MIALTVIGIILGFLLLDLGIQYFENRKAARATSAIPQTATFDPKKLLSDFLMPLGYFFHPGHTWARIQEKGLVTVGADDFAHKALGRIDRITLPKVGQELRLNSPAFKIIQGQKEASFVAPVNGTVLEVNEKLIQNPSLLKEQPYKTGWVLKMRPTSISDDLKPLFIADKAVKWLKSEIGALRDFLVGIAGQGTELGTTVADGGIPVSGVLEEFDSAEWKKFEKRFLSNHNSGDAAS
jgi:glycine cleavage system H lipoate-binding protein